MFGIEDHFEGDRLAGDPNLELELVAAIDPTHDAPVPRQGHALGPGPLTRFGADRITQDFEHRVI